jgi:nucleotide sugar dehydrogenase
MKVAVFGLGYAGTVSAACLATADHDVWGVDVDEEKVRAVAAGSSPVVEPGLDELVCTVTEAGALHATTDAAAALDGADIAIVCVGTPSTAHGRVDLSQVERAVREVACASQHAAPPPSGVRSVVMRSTVPVGTVDDVVAPILAAAPPHDWRFGVAMCPEFLRESSGITDFFDPPFVVVGTTDCETAAAVVALFAFIGHEVRVVGTREAEALKYVCNAFHATKVSFTNELAETLLGKGFRLRIYDPIVNPARLIGANRSYVESKLPHLCRLLADSAQEALADVDVAIVSSTDGDTIAALLDAPPPLVIDLSGRLGHDVETVPGYTGIGW